ncbi:hypothetical protein [Absidia glauca]|uniref:Ndc10 domain-containing protein n=1 Tax=Absidia glauca TaxID=4829 RepID=A0A163JTI7_ABSGL|nr:hypothetical protein [Absidia glauca]
MADFPTNRRSFYLSHAALSPPTSLCKMLSRRSTNDMTDWRQKNSALTTKINLPSLSMHFSAPAIPNDDIQSSPTLPTCQSKGIAAN